MRGLRARRGGPQNQSGLAVGAAAAEVATYSKKRKWMKKLEGKRLFIDTANQSTRSRKVCVVCVRRARGQTERAGGQHVMREVRCAGQYSSGKSYGLRKACYPHFRPQSLM
jgi:hypothetical protein